MTDKKCVYYGDCKFNHCKCEEDEPFFRCPDRKIDKTLIAEIEKYNFTCEAGNKLQRIYFAERNC